MDKDSIDIKQVSFFDIDVEENKTNCFHSPIDESIDEAEKELQEIQLKIEETEQSLNSLTPKSDKIDYALAVSSGVLCGLIDIFLVGKPGESPLGNITDKWFKDVVDRFAKLNKCSSLKALEKKYKVPYDQTTGGPIFKDLIQLNTENHHFKSLAHNPTLLGLFFSIVDQFSSPNLSHFVSNGELITLVDSEGKFTLRGNNIVSKFFCAFVNWIGHLMSDASGSSSSKGRGMGIPSPLMTWSNDVIAIKRSLKIKPSSFDKTVNELAMKMFLDGYDTRFQTAQAIPVFINSMVTRFIYSLRRMIKYISNNKDNFSFKEMWKECEPFKNASVKRMLTVAHGVFCGIDICDAVVRGILAGWPAGLYECIVRLNVVGLGRFAICLFGETKYSYKRWNLKIEYTYLSGRKKTANEYLESLHLLAEVYNDENLITFTDDFKNGEYQKGFNKTIALADKRGAQSLKSLDDIDEYFNRGK